MVLQHLGTQQVHKLTVRCPSKRTMFVDHFPDLDIFASPIIGSCPRAIYVSIA